MSSDRPLLGRTILILEDDYYQAMDAQETLERAGAKVIGPVADQKGAIAAIAGSIDCAVLDINLGGHPCFDTARELHGRRVPILFLTGYDRTVIPAEFDGASMLQKPVADRDLIAAVRQLGSKSTG